MANQPSDEVRGGEEKEEEEDAADAEAVLESASSEEEDDDDDDADGGQRRQQQAPREVTFAAPTPPPSTVAPVVGVAPRAPDAPSPSPLSSPERRALWSSSVASPVPISSASSAPYHSGNFDPYYRPPRNSALLLLSPRFSSSPDARDLVRSSLLARLGPSARIEVDASIPGERIGRWKLAEYQYGEAARYALEAEPGELRGGEVDEGEFERAFGERWSDAVSFGRVTNALRALTKLGVDPIRLGRAWREAERRGTPTPKTTTTPKRSRAGVVRLGPDFLCGLLSVGEKSLYVLNGWFPEARGRYVGDGAAVHAFGVEWDPTGSINWKTFREGISGCTSGSGGGGGGGGGAGSTSSKGAATGWPRRPHPMSEADGSLRRVLWERRAELGLVGVDHRLSLNGDGGSEAGSEAEAEERANGNEDDVDDEYDGWDDVLYVAPSPLESLADRCAWLLGGDPRDPGSSSSPSDDLPYGRTLLGRGIPERKIVEWFENPVVTVPPPPPPSYSDGTPKRVRVFDAVRGCDADECTRRLLEIYDWELREMGREGGGCACAVS